MDGYRVVIRFLDVYFNRMFYMQCAVNCHFIRYIIINSFRPHFAFKTSLIQQGLAQRLFWKVLCWIKILWLKPIGVLWHFSLFKAGISRWVHCAHKKIYSGRLWYLNDAQLVWWGAKKLFATSLNHHHWQLERLIEGITDLCFLVVFAKFWPYYLKVTLDIEIHHTGQSFSNLLLPTRLEKLELWSSTPSTSRFKRLCIQRSSSVASG